MIIWEGTQGTDEWLQARSAIPTASSFGKIITATGKASATAKTYMNQLLADWLAGHPVDKFEPTQAMIDGTDREEQARSAYEFEKDVTVEEIGLVYLNEDKLVSCSPDGFVGDKGMVEIKNPKASTLISYMLAGGVPAIYKPQIYGQMWVCEREWVDFWVQHPEIAEPYLFRVDRDDEYIKVLSDGVLAFVDKMLEAREKLSN